MKTQSCSGRPLFLFYNLLVVAAVVLVALFVQPASSITIMGQTFSATQFFVHGKRHFTKTGYTNHIKSYYKESVQTRATLKLGDEGADNVDLTGKVVVVTGANSGLGKEVATYMACKGAKLYMLCRSADRAAVARQEIMRDAGIHTDNDQQVQVCTVDVSELEQVRAVAKELQSKESEIHCLVCNAGVLLNEQTNSSEGIESTFASHLLGGTYLLTSLLMPQLQAAQDSRVVVVSSGGMYTTPLPSWNAMTSYTTRCSSEGDEKEEDKKKLFKYDGNMAYAYAKRGQVVLVEEWSKLYSTTPDGNSNDSSNDVAFVTVHPGWADTPAVTEAYGDQKKWLEPLREPWQGAEGVAWLAATDHSNLESGAFYLDRKVQKKHLAGPFMTEEGFTKNKPEEIQTFMEHLKKAAGLE